MLYKILLYCYSIIVIYAGECVKCERPTTQDSEIYCLKDNNHVLCSTCYKNIRQSKECPKCKGLIFNKTYWFSKSLLDCMGLEDITLHSLASHLKYTMVSEEDDEDGTSPILQLCYNRSIDFQNKAEIFLFLKNNAFSIDRPNRLGDTPLSACVANRDIKMTELLLCNGADPKAQIHSRPSYFGTKSPMTEAVTNNDTEIMSLLNSRGVPFEPKDLEWAYYKKSLNAAKLIMDQVIIKKDAKGLFGRTLLMWAAESGDRELLEKTLKIPDINLEEKDDEGKTAYYLAPKKLKSLICLPVPLDKSRALVFA